MKKMIKIGNAQAFWGDRTSAAELLARQVPTLDYLTLDYLAEVSLSIMAIQREKDPTLGYARDFVDVVKSLIPLWQNGSKLKVVCNAGGLNPKGCAEACARALKEAGLAGIKIGVVFGDDVLPQIKSSPNEFLNMESKENATPLLDRMITANAYLGAQSLVEALNQGAQIVITGRVADPSLTVAPCVAEFGWRWNDYDKIAAATIAGHVIECGTQATGGFSTHWMDLPDPATIGFPVVEVQSDGTFVVTKPAGTGGAVTVETVKEQLLYEIGDPDNYLSPDVTASFLSLSLEQKGINRIAIAGAKGKAPPKTYKVSATYRDGFRADAMLAVYGLDAAAKARRAGEVILAHVAERGYSLERTSIECLGAGEIVPGVRSSSPIEVVLRVAVADPRREAVECFTKEIAPLITCGPQGITGYTAGRPKVRPIFSYWPTLIDVASVDPIVEVITT